MRWLLIFLVLGCSNAHLDECPNPAMESMAWRPVEGTVVAVDSAKAFRMRTDEGQTIDVTLANAGEPFDAGATDTLRRMIDGKRVTLFISSSSDPEPVLTGEVHDARGTDIANRLLRSGAVSYTDAPAYTLSGYAECLNRIAEREAKAKRRGVWRQVTARP